MYIWYCSLLVFIITHRRSSDSGEKVALKLSVPEAKIVSAEDEDEMEEESVF